MGIITCWRLLCDGWCFNFKDRVIWGSSHAGGCYVMGGASISWTGIYGDHHMLEVVK